MYTHERYNHNCERKDIYIKRFERMYNTNDLGIQKSLMLFDIITALGGNKRRDSGAFIEPMKVNNIDNGFINYIINEYSHDHMLCFELCNKERPEMKDLKRMYFELMYVYMNNVNANVNEQK